MDDPTSIVEDFVNGLNLPANDDFHLQLLVHAIEEITTNMNCFNKDKHPCAIYGQKGHSFDGCPQFKNTNVEQAYIQLLLLFNNFVKGLKKLDPTGQNKDLQTVQGLTLSELDAIEHLDIQLLSQVPSSSSPLHEDRVDCIYSLLEHSMTPLLNQHIAIISNLSTLLENRLDFRGGSRCNDTDEDIGSTNPGSQASLHNIDALSSLQNFWKDGHGN